MPEKRTLSIQANMRVMGPANFKSYCSLLAPHYGRCFRETDITSRAPWGPWARQAVNRVWVVEKRLPSNPEGKATHFIGDSAFYKEPFRGQVRIS